MSARSPGKDILTEPNCETVSPDKVFFREQADGQIISISMAKDQLEAGLNFELMIQHLPAKVEPETVCQGHFMILSEK